MVWLLIIFCLAVVLSPLLWMKSSPRQRQITQCREVARSLAINVNIHRRPDARESEQRLDTVFYWLRWRDNKQVEPWVLHRYSSRGWESGFEGWQWISGQASAEWISTIELVVALLPVGVTAIIANKEGIGMVWDERGESSTVREIHHCIEKLREKGEKIYT